MRAGKEECTVKKWIIVEICVLVLLVTGACVACLHLTRGQTQNDTQPATEPAVETTEPTEPLVRTWADLPTDYVLTSSQYFVYDVAEDQFTMISGQPEDKVYPASITKLFTAYVAMQHLSAEEQVTVGDELDMIDWDSTVAQLQKGDTLTVEELVGGMLLPSGNDAAHVLAAAAGRKIANQTELSASAAVAAFVEEMNRQTKVLGMTGSRFANPDGIHHEAHYLSMKDMAKLGKLSLENPVVMAYASTAEETLQIGEREVVWKNTNALIHDKELTFRNEMEDGTLSEELLRNFYCEYAVGLKTGRTTPAGSCLLSAFDVRGRQLIIGVFGGPDGEFRFADTLFLLNTELGLQ